ncbi:MAG: hypothetical protein P4K86_09395 [Terracidiphilus sp.]|nr:hypothetical protein [Terracidiphilus sp.]
MNERNAPQEQRSRFVYREEGMGEGAVVSDNNQRAASGRRAQRNSYALYTMQYPRLQPPSAKEKMKNTICVVK